MKLSVSVVTFQQVEYVRQAVESALRQDTGFPFEVIVGDDASTDGTREVLEDIRAGAPDRVKLLLAEKNYGDYGLSNVMATIDAAQGDYIAFLDGDDFWTTPDKLQRQVDFLDAHPECAICAHRVEHLSEDGFRQLSPRPAAGEGTYDIGELLVENFAPKISTVVRRSALDALPQWYRTTKVASADWVFNVLTGRTGKVGFIDDVMAVHRKRGDSLTSYYGANRLLSDKLAALGVLRPYFPRHAKAMARAERRIRWKLRVARLGPRAYLLAQRLYARPGSRLVG